jgi:diadenosine tetraphosphate (Ap4A) HIT family hydrolase
VFILNERLKADTTELGRLELSLLLLMNDRSLPWLILVPEQEGIKEIDELPPADRSMLIEEIACVSGVIRGLYHPQKINVGSLGNLVSQLHVHVIGRFSNDRAWPGSIWGTGPLEVYGSDELNEVTSKIRAFLKGRLK